MNKRRERLSPVIDAERRKSGVLERRANGLEVECAQLGRDLVIARASIAKSIETIRTLQVQLARARGDINRMQINHAERVEHWSGLVRDYGAKASAFEHMPLWRIAAQRIAARFRRSA